MARNLKNLKTLRIRSFSAAHRKKTFHQAIPQPQATMRPLLLVDSVDIQCNMHTRVKDRPALLNNIMFLKVFCSIPVFRQKKLPNPSRYDKVTPLEAIIELVATLPLKTRHSNPCYLSVTQIFCHVTQKWLSYGSGFGQICRRGGGGGGEFWLEMKKKGGLDTLPINSTSCVFSYETSRLSGYRRSRYNRYDKLAKNERKRKIQICYDVLFHVLPPFNVKFPVKFPLTRHHLTRLHIKAKLGLILEPALFYSPTMKIRRLATAMLTTATSRSIISAALFIFFPPFLLFFALLRFHYTRAGLSRH
jgi:hypothetical protein